MLLELEKPLTLQVSQEKIADLPVTGFNVKQEVQNLFTDYQTNSEQAFARTGRNILSWLREYPLRMVVLPIEIEIAEVNGEKRIFSTKDNQETWAESAILQERNGAVAETCQQIESFLVNSPPGSLAFFVSPKGPTGLKDEYGSDIIHPDTQIFVYSINNRGELSGNTLIADIELEENENFLSHLSDFEVLEGNEEERVEKVVRSPVFLESDGSWAFGLEGVLLSVHQIINRENETTALYGGLSQEIPNLDFIRKRIEEFENETVPLLADVSNEKIVRQKLTEALLDCSKGLNEEEAKPYVFEEKSFPEFHPRRTFSDYWEEAARLSQMGGCAGGKCDLKDGEAVVAQTSVGTTTYTKKENSEKDLCNGCGRSPKVSGGLCSSCNKKAKKT